MKKLDESTSTASDETSRRSGSAAAGNADVVAPVQPKSSEGAEAADDICRRWHGIGGWPGLADGCGGGGISIGAGGALLPSRGGGSVGGMPCVVPEFVDAHATVLARATRASDCWGGAVRLASCVSNAWHGAPGCCRIGLLTRSERCDKRGELSGQRQGGAAYGLGSEAEGVGGYVDMRGCGCD